MEMQVGEKCEFCENGLIQNPQWQEFYKTYGEEELRKMSHEKYEECLREFFCINKYVSIHEINLPSEEIPCDECEGSTWLYKWIEIDEIFEQRAKVSA